MTFGNLTFSNLILKGFNFFSVFIKSIIFVVQLGWVVENDWPPPHVSCYLSLLAFGLAKMDNIGQDDCASKEVALNNGRWQILVAKWVRGYVIIITYAIWAFTQKVIISK